MVCVCNVCVYGVCVWCVCVMCVCMCVSHKLVEGAHCEGVDVDLTTKDSPELESGNER